MSLSLTQTKTALGPNCIASFLGVGGTGPYAYAVLSGGAGGSIDPVTGTYTAPSSVQEDPTKLYDTIQVTDSASATATAQILVGTPLLLFCEVLQQELGLASGRVFLWDQKVFQPTDSDLYIAVSVPSCKPFGNSTKPDPTTGWANAVQSVNMLATLDLDIISRGPAARDRKEEVIMALNSVYAQQQQEGNGFYIGKLPPGGRFINLSQIDGAAIPYRFKISVNIQYAVTKSKAVDYFDTFSTPTIAIDPKDVPTPPIPPPPPFTPINLMNLFIWLDAAHVVESGGLVSQMTDQSGNGHHFVQANSALQPSLVPAAQGGLPAVRAAGAQWLNRAGVNWPKPGSIFAVFKNANGSGYQGLMSDTNAVDNPDWSANALGFVLFTNGQFCAATTIFDPIGGQGVNTHYLSFIRDVGGISAWWDSVQAFSGHGDVPGNNGNLILLAGYAGRWSGDLQELVITSSVVSDTDRQKMENYFRTKYSL